MLTVKAIRSLVTVFVLLASGQSADVENIQMQGRTIGYMLQGSQEPYSLSCNYRAGYNDEVYSVAWLKDGHVIAGWNIITKQPLAFSFTLINHLVSSSMAESEGKRLRFRNISLEMGGNYTFQVESSLGISSSKPYPVRVIDIPSEDFITQVTIMGMAEHDNTTYQEEREEDANCTLLWTFSSPAIYPRPNVTCGYFSYVHEDIVVALPAGLTMTQLANKSWIAQFEHTHIQVSDIPHKTRLGCSISIPNTSYRKIIKMEDNLVIDNLIDSAGCPSFELSPWQRIQISLNEGVLNCRGDVVPMSRLQPAKLILRCLPGEVAVFPNKTFKWYWKYEMECNADYLSWGLPTHMNTSSNIATADVTPIGLPTCLSGVNHSIHIRASIWIFWVPFVALKCFLSL